MKLDFKISADGLLEAIKHNRIYRIFPLNDKYNATINNEDVLLLGDLYECLDACNQHAYEADYRKKLDVIKECDGCSFKLVNDITFKDHNDEYAVAIARRFRSIDAMRNFIKNKSEEAIVYIYDLREYHLGEIWYYLKCAVRKK